MSEASRPSVRETQNLETLFNRLIIRVDGVDYLASLHFDDSGSVVNPPSSELVETLQELCSRLTALIAMKQHGNESLRVTLLTGSTTAATGTLTGVTTVTTLTNFGTGQPAYIVGVSQNNLLAELGNVANVTIT